MEKNTQRRNSYFVLFTKYYYGDQIETWAYEMGEICSGHEWQEVCIYIKSQLKNLAGTCHIGDFIVDGKTILKYIQKKWSVRI